jgi:hypothetical protein
MAAIKNRLDELVKGAAGRHLRGEAVSAWCSAQGQAWLREAAAQLAHEVAEEARRAAKQGDYRRARKIAELNLAYLSAGAGLTLDNEVPLEQWPGWSAFREACELAERIDCFLAAVGRGAQGAGLAADCRECLDTLLVLADWCDDQGRPAAAAEARHLHALASSLP